MSLSSRCIRRPVAVAMLFVAVGFLGVISWVRLPIDLLPDVAYPRLVVYSSYPNVAPSEVERFVTERIEQRVATVSGVESVESVSREGISLVSLRFAWRTDMDFAALNVREQLDNLRGQLPEDVSPVVLRTDPQSEPIMAISVSGDEGVGRLFDLAEAVFRRRLEQIDGVAQAAVTGGLEREIQVEVDADRLESYGLTIAGISEAIDAANASAPGGTVRQGNFRFSLRTLGEFRSMDEMGGVVVGRQGPGADSAAADDDGMSDGNGQTTRNTVTLSDVATITDGYREPESMASYNGEEAVGLMVFKESGANTVQVAERVEEVIEQLSTAYPTVSINVAMSQAVFVSEAISNVVQALILGGFLAFLVLFLFLRDPRYPVAIALAIPISVVGTFSLLDLAGVSLNIMSLGGLALGVGMLVDNSIVVLENIFRHREQGVKATVAAALAAEEVQGAITASTLTTISVFGPIIYIEGIAGELFGAVSFAVAFSLLVSLLVALTLLPTMAARWRGGAGPTGGGRLNAFDRAFSRFADWYHGLLERALDNRARVAATALVLLAGAVAVGVTLDRAVLPDVDQGAFQANLTLEPGTPLDETASVAARLEQLFLEDDEVDAVFTRVGRRADVAGVEEEESGLNTASLEVRLVPGASTEPLLARLRPRLAGFPPGSLTLETGQATALGRLLGGEEADLAVRVRGEDLEVAFRHAGYLATQLAAVPSLTNVRLGAELGQPELRVQIDRERAAAFGIEPRTIAETVEDYMRGRTATEYLEFDRKIPVVVRLPDEARHSAETLRVLQVEDVPLRELITTEEAAGPSEVRRVGQGRVVTVHADVAGGGLNRALADAAAVLDANPAPGDLRVEIGGGNEEMRRSFRDLAFAFGLALILVYMILAAQFESLLHPFTILLSVPLAVIGVSSALWLTGAGLNTMSLIGVIVLVGIVVNDAIIKVDFIHQARRRGLATRAAILEAGQARLRPIVMTTVTTVLGLAPMALGIGTGADLRAPLAIAVIGGLTTATALTLIVVPVTYDLVESGRVRITRLLGREQQARS